jgi:hypothetical protein
MARFVKPCMVADSGECQRVLADGVNDVRGLDGKRCGGSAWWRVRTRRKMVQEGQRVIVVVDSDGGVHE